MCYNNNREGQSPSQRCHYRVCRFGDYLTKNKSQIHKTKREVTQMEMFICVNGKQIGDAISGCEYIGEAWVKAQELAEMLDVSCALVSAETGEVIAWWEA